MAFAALAIASVEARGQVVTAETTPTCFRALQQLSEAYAKAHPGVSFKIDYGGAYAAVEEVGKNESDIGCIEYPLRKLVDRAWAEAFPDGKGPAAQHVLGQTALGIVVHKKNTVSKLTHEQLRQICSGKTGSWREVGGSGGRIRIVSSHALSHTLVSDMLIDYRQWSKEFEKLLADSNVIATVAADGAAIGFVALTPDLPKDVKLVPIAVDAKSPAVPPTIENVVLQKYSLVRQYRLILSAKAPPAAHDFARFACSKDAAKTMHAWGLFPVAIRDEAEGEKRLADYKAGKGTPVVVCGLAGGEELARGLAVEYVKAKALVQVKYDGRATAEEAQEAFQEAGELMLTEGQSPSPPAPLPKGEGSKTPTHHSQLTSDHSQLTTHPLGHRAVGVIVHRDNSAKELTLDDLRQIYSGQIDTWPGASGKDARMKLVGLGPETVTMRLLAQVVSGQLSVVSGDALTPGPSPERRGETGRHARITRREDTAKVVQAVGNDAGAIGFVDLAAMPPKESSVKLLAILAEGAKKAAAPSPESVPEGYPLDQAVTLSVHPRASETAKDFAAFIAAHGPEVQAVLKTHGIIPAPPPKVELAKQAAGRSPTESPPTVLGQWGDESENGGARAEREGDKSENEGRKAQEEAAKPGPAIGITARSPGQAGLDALPTGEPPLDNAGEAADGRLVVGVALVAAAAALGLLTLRLARR